MRKKEKMVKKIISIAVIIVGAFMVLSGVAPMIIGAILESRAASSIGIIGGADGPTTLMVAGVIGTGNVVIEILVGVLLVIAGIWGLRKCKK